MQKVLLLLLVVVVVVVVVVLLLLPLMVFVVDAIIAVVFCCCCCCCCCCVFVFEFVILRAQPCYIALYRFCLTYIIISSHQLPPLMLTACLKMENKHGRFYGLQTSTFNK